MNISVVIPTNFRGERYLSRSVASVLTQRQDSSIGQVEIIVVNNTDAPLRFKDMENPTVRVLSATEKQTATHARNAGAAAANHPVLAFLDDDDWWEPDFLRTMVPQLQGSDCHMVVCGNANHFHGQDGPRPGKVLPPTANKESFLEGNPGFNGSNFVMLADFFKTMEGWDEDLYSSNDRDFFIRFLECGGKFQVVPEFLCNKDQTPTSRITMISPEKTESTLKFIMKHASSMHPPIYRFNRFKYELYAWALAGRKKTSLVRLVLRYPLLWKKILKYVIPIIRDEQI